MKRYKKSIFSRYAYYLTALFFVIILQIIDYQTDLYSLMIILISIYLILKSIYSYYIIKDQKFSLPMAETIDILKIKSIHKRKFFFFNKYYFDFKMSQFRWISIYPLQLDIDAIINDLKDINPNIIIKEYKAYNENF